MNWTRNLTGSLLLAALMGLGAWGGTARAGADVDFGAAIHVGDDADLFLAISSRYFDRDRDEVQQYEGRYGNPDDTAVALFLCSRSGQPPERIYQLRQRHLTWWQIGVQLGVPVEAWFVHVSGTPARRFGNSYGHWHRYQRNSHYRMVLSDKEARDLVAVRMVHEYYGMSPDQAMRARGQGGDVRKLVAQEYRGRHSQGEADRGGNRSPGDRGNRGGGADHRNGNSHRNDNSSHGAHDKDKGHG